MAVLCRLSYSSTSYAGPVMIEAVRRLRPVIALVALLSACSERSGATLHIDTEGDVVEVRVEVADSQVEMARGLMGREHLDEDAGMVFVSPEPTDTSFWMKDTLIPLSVAFWDEGGRIFRIHDMEPCREEPCPLYEPGGPWIGAVEVNRGFFEAHGVQVGDRVRLDRPES
jgi:uncharacterized membrane protein (UPF0127 family)